MLNSAEERKKYIEATRLKNYRASMVLEGISSNHESASLSKSQLIQKYKNIGNKYRSCWSIDDVPVW
ncbi:MAG: DUF2559 domain-containing protein [Moraxellaceae bacterium]|nr:MAG: DUF2559 domain-containing protein [Moraxellaceae bacterium]